jgi:hypothetical protein
MSERDFQSAITAYARATGWRVYHNPDSRRSEPGFPDLVLLNGTQRRLVFAELKTESGVLRAAQREWIADLEAVAQPPETHVWRPLHWARGDIERTLRGVIR